jgi:hypothetical protein
MLLLLHHYVEKLPMPLQQVLPQQSPRGMPRILHIRDIRGILELPDNPPLDMVLMSDKESIHQLHSLQEAAQPRVQTPLLLNT